MDNMTGTAEFDETECYRFVLTRKWGADKFACFIGMNPSTATAEVNDPTVRRCIGFARDWGYGGLLMLNLFAYRTPSIPELFKARLRGQDIVGDWRNSLTALAGYIRTYNAGIVIAAWGIHAKDRGFRALRMLDTDKPLHVLGWNADHSPKHPLYLRGDLQPVSIAGELCTF